ncbi:MAG: SAM-dependent DNA methyltransferase [Bacilli bacterium]|nr:SAM-dependent DNA methyltransferase [Bacilli bacterium]
MKQQIKSRDRVVKHGEVFTSDREVNNMLLLVKDEVERPESTFLEPACGDGNFLIEILKRKLDVISVYKRSQLEYEKWCFICASSLYGVEIMLDNVCDCRKRLSDYTIKVYRNIYKKKANKDFEEVIKFIFEKNILHGDALTLLKSDGEPIRFSEWKLITGSKVKRRDYYLSELLDPSIKKINDEDKLGILSEPVAVYPAVSFMKVIEYV